MATQIYKRGYLNELNILLSVNRTFCHNLEDQTTQAGNIVYTYTDDDFLAKKQDGTETTLYDYSSMGELKSVTLPGGMVVSYTHDVLTRPVAKSIDGSIVEKYLWNGRTQLLAVLEPNGAVRQRFIYADDRLPYAMTQDNQIFYMAYDQVGSLRIITDSSGNVVKEIRYDTFGNIVSDSNPSFAVPFGFAGGLHDIDTGLVRFGYRDYAPEIGRWTAKDPIGFAGGDSNLYGYVFSDPVNFVDPEGLRGTCLDFINAVDRAVNAIDVCKAEYAQCSTTEEQIEFMYKYNAEWHTQAMRNCAKGNTKEDVLESLVKSGFECAWGINLKRKKKKN